MRRSFFLQCVSNQGRPIAWKGIRKYRRSFNQAGIPKASCRTWMIAINQQYLSALFLKFECDANADDAGAQYSDIRSGGWYCVLH
jgi:hypothetical protein